MGATVLHSSDIGEIGTCHLHIKDDESLRQYMNLSINIVIEKYTILSMEEPIENKKNR